MENNKKLSFFQKVILSITDFRFYPYILKTEKLSRSFGHFILFIMIITAIITCKFSFLLFDRIDSFLSEYDEIVPEFSLTDGTLSISTKDTIILENEVVTVIDTDKTAEEFLNSNEYKNTIKYDSRLYINSDLITYEDEDGIRTSIALSDVGNDYDKTSFYEYLTEIYNSPSSKILIFGVLYFGILCGYLIIKIIEVLLLSVFASLVSVLYRIKIDFKNYIKIALYIITLPYIIELISILVVGSIKDYTVFVSNILSYIYIFYAIRAVKLDAFLLIVNNKNKTNINNINQDINNTEFNIDINNNTENKDDGHNSQDDNHSNETNDSNTDDKDNNDGGQD